MLGSESSHRLMALLNFKAKTNNIKMFKANIHVFLGTNFLKTVYNLLCRKSIELLFSAIMNEKVGSTMQDYNLKTKHEIYPRQELQNCYSLLAGKLLFIKYHDCFLFCFVSSFIQCKFSRMAC